MKVNKQVTLTVVFFFGLIFQMIACTSFCLRNNNQMVLCKNLDWDFGSGHIEINKRGLLKKAFVAKNETPVKWISKYGSITFNHIGKEFPLGGMNEAGLVIEEMNYYWTKYPEVDNRPALNELQWIQYQLDNCSTVEEVLSSDSAVRISGNLFKIHYLVCDKKGNVATVEFLNGKMVVHTKDSLPIPVLTNHKYDESVDELKNYVGFGGNWNIPQRYESMNNFIRVSSMIKEYNEETPIIDYSFHILSSVSTYDTQWSIVYDIANSRIYFKTREYDKLKWIDLNYFDFGCNSRAHYINVNTQYIESLNDKFMYYNMDNNKQLVNTIYKEYSTNGYIDDEFNESFFKRIAKYPETIICRKE